MTIDTTSRYVSMPWTETFSHFGYPKAWDTCSCFVARDFGRKTFFLYSNLDVWQAWPPTDNVIVNRRLRSKIQDRLNRASHNLSKLDICERVFLPNKARASISRFRISKMAKSFRSGHRYISRGYVSMATTVVIRATNIFIAYQSHKLRYAMTSF